MEKSKVNHKNKIFGLHFMSLDIRQHSSVHENAVDEIISLFSPILVI